MAAALAQKADAAPDNSQGEWRNRQSGMAYRQLGRTGFMISEVVMGGVQINPERWEHILPALDRGLNYLDTASAYGRGQSEIAYAKVIKARPRDSFFLSSKVSSWPDDRDKLFKDIYDSLDESERKRIDAAAREEIERQQMLADDHLVGYFGGQRGQVEASARSLAMEKKYGGKIDRSREHKAAIIESVEASLKRLGTDYLDIVHCPHGASTENDLNGYPEIFEAFEQLKKAGKARHLGFSAHNNPGSTLAAAVETGMYSMGMVAYNIVNDPYVRPALEKAKKAGVGVVAMKVARAVYNGRGDGTQDDPARVARMHELVPGSLKVPQKAYLWGLRNENLSAVISNMTDLAMVDDNLPLAGKKGGA